MTAVVLVAAAFSALLLLVYGASIVGRGLRARFGPPARHAAPRGTRSVR